MSANGGKIKWVPNGKMPAGPMTKADIAKASFALLEIFTDRDVLPGRQVGRDLREKGRPRENITVFGFFPVAAVRRTAL